MLIVTTAISGSGRDDYLKKAVEYAAARGKSVKIYHVGDMLFAHAAKMGIPLTPENILNTNPAVISAIRSAVFEQIIRELARVRKQYDAIIVNVHAMFFWKHVFQRTWDNYYVPQLRPDLFVTFLSDAVRVQRHLQERKQWRPTAVTHYDALLWSNVEVEVTAGWSEILRKRHYVISVLASPALFYRLMFERDRETAYVSMPLTHSGHFSTQKQTDKFIRALEKHFIVFDPRSVELVTPSSGNKKNTALYHQIVARDLYWLVRQSDRFIAYFPKVVSSPGVIHEIREAYESNKEVWVVWPKDAFMSPFISYYAHRVFESPEALIRFLKKKHQKSREF